MVDFARTELSRTPKKLNRRDFLKLAGVGVAGLAFNALKLDNFTNNVLFVDSLINVDSGIGSRLRREKLEMASQKGVLEPWLKFAALEVYATANKLCLCQATLRQFMFKDGAETLSVSELIPKSIRNNITDVEMRPDEVNQKTDAELLTIFSQTAINGAMRVNPDMVTRSLNLAVEPVDLWDKLVSNGFSDSLSVSGAGALQARDFMCSMNAFTFDYSGSIASAQHYDSGSWEAKTLPGEFRLRDRYDWQNRQLFQGAELNLAVAAGFVVEIMRLNGVDDPRDWLVRQVGVETYRRWNDISVLSVTDDDGLRLQESGVCTPFNIESRWQTGEMNLVIPDQVLGR